MVTNVGTGDETVLNEADVPIIDTAVSNQPGWYDGALTPEMLTAGTASGGKDSCQVGRIREYQKVCMVGARSGRDLRAIKDLFRLGLSSTRLLPGAIWAHFGWTPSGSVWALS